MVPVADAENQMHMGIVYPQPGGGIRIARAGTGLSPGRKISI
jgi:hypothetical protein